MTSRRDLIVLDDVAAGVVDEEAPLPAQLDAVPFLRQETRESPLRPALAIV